MPILESLMERGEPNDGVEPMESLESALLNQAIVYSEAACLGSLQVLHLLRNMIWNPEDRTEGK